MTQHRQLEKIFEGIIDAAPRLDFGCVCVTLGILEDDGDAHSATRRKELEWRLAQLSPRSDNKAY